MDAPHNNGVAGAAVDDFLSEVHMGQPGGAGKRGEPFSLSTTALDGSSSAEQVPSDKACHMTRFLVFPERRHRDSEDNVNEIKEGEFEDDDGDLRVRRK